MSTAAIRTSEYTAPATTLFVALELGERDWKFAVSTGLGQPARVGGVRGRDAERLLTLLEDAKRRAGAQRIVSCYEAGRDGFWLDRFLLDHGIDNLVVDSSSIEVRRRARRLKTDRLDAKKLLTMNIRYALGERDLWSVVHVPSPEDEDARSLQREYRTLVRERARSSNRIRGLLANHGLRPERIDARFPEWLEQARLWDGQPIPLGAQRRIAREYDRWRFTHDQVLEVELERRKQLRSGEGRTLDIARRLCKLRGIGPGSSCTYATEFFGWRHFRNAKQVGALAGLAPTPHQSGDLARELGISKSGNRHVRAIAIEIAWGWLRHQPDSALSLWYAERFARGGPRARKVGIVALARKLLVALWRYVETDVVPEGAKMKT